MASTSTFDKARQFLWKHYRHRNPKVTLVVEVDGRVKKALVQCSSIEKYGKQGFISMEHPTHRQVVSVPLADSHLRAVYVGDHLIAETEAFVSSTHGLVMESAAPFKRLLREAREAHGEHYLCYLLSEGLITEEQAENEAASAVIELPVDGEDNAVDTCEITQIFKISEGNRKIQHPIFSMRAGYTCPFAKKCFSRAVVDKETGKTTVKDGPDTEFRCYAASQEAQYPNVQATREHNEALAKLMLKTGGPKAFADKMIETFNTKGDKGASFVWKNNVFRIHESGDFFSKDYMEGWAEVAKRAPGILFYAYTKSFPFSQEVSRPSNFKLIHSLGGKYDEAVLNSGEQFAAVISSAADWAKVDQGSNTVEGWTYTFPDGSESKPYDLPLDWDDSSAYKYDEPFALAVHGTQPAGSEAGKTQSKVTKSDLYKKKKSEKNKGAHDPLLKMDSVERVVEDDNIKKDRLWDRYDLGPDETHDEEEYCGCGDPMCRSCERDEKRSEWEAEHPKVEFQLGYLLAIEKAEGIKTYSGKPGLSYPAFVGISLKGGTNEEWEVYPVEDEHGNEVKVYGQSIVSAKEEWKGFGRYADDIDWLDQHNVDWKTQRVFLDKENNDMKEGLWDKVKPSIFTPKPKALGQTTSDFTKAMAAIEKLYSLADSADFDPNQKDEIKSHLGAVEELFGLFSEVRHRVSEACSCEMSSDKEDTLVEVTAEVEELVKDSLLTLEDLISTYYPGSEGFRSIVDGLLDDLWNFLISDDLKEAFKSDAQRRYFYHMASKPGAEGKKWAKMAKKFEKETPEGADLPEKVQESPHRDAQALEKKAVNEDLYDDLRNAGIETSNHESDLYFKHSPEAVRILSKYPTERGNSRKFVSHIDNTLWVEVPFSYTPWWEKRLKIAAPEEKKVSEQASGRESLPAYRIYLDNGKDYVTSMAKDVTLSDAKDYFIGKEFEQRDGSMARVTDVEELTEAIKKDTEVKVPHRGHMVTGKIVRYDKGDEGGSPFYVVDVGEYASIIVPAHNVSVAEAMAIAPNNIPGGMSVGHELDEVSEEQLFVGLTIEMEHTNDPQIALEIAMDHLIEDPDYYWKFMAAGLE